MLRVQTDIDRWQRDRLLEALDSYRRNPVALWAHNHTRPAIGRALDVWPHDHSLMARVEFAPTPFAQEVDALYRAGYQRGVSVGFKPIRFEMRREGSTGKLLGVRFIEQELLEISAAPVPANASALRKALDNAPLLQGYYNDIGNDQWDFREIMAALKSIQE